MDKKFGIRIESDKIVYDGKFIQVIARHFVGSKGGKGVWELVRRKAQGNIVCIVAITRDKEILLEKIFRLPLNAYVLELPAGLMDIGEESEREVVERELLEETGYRVDNVEELALGPFNAGLLDCKMALYLGTNARLVQNQQLENAEDIEVIKVPLKQLIDYLTTQKEILVDLKIASVIPYLEKKGLI